MTLSPFLAWVAGLPEEAVQPRAARAVLAALAAHADGGREDPTHDELVALSGYASRTVERYVAALAKPEAGEALVVVERVRSAEGWPRNRYRLLAPLNIVEAAGLHRLAVHIAQTGTVGGVAGLVDGVSPAATPAAAVTGGPAAAGDSLPPVGREACRRSGGPAAAVTGGQYEEQARARARHFPSFHPSFSEFAWPNDDIAERAARVMKACGPGLRAIEADPERMLGSLAQLLTGEWARLDLDRDVIPVVKESTKRPRRNPLCDFKLPARDVAAKVGRRAMSGASTGQPGLGAFGKRASSGAHVEAAVADPARRRAERMASIARIIGIIDSGQRPEWTLDADERVLARADAEAAFARAMARYRAELSALEGEGDGGGDGGR